jgi:hypothetical protein
VDFVFYAIRHEHENEGPCAEITSTFLVAYDAENLTDLRAEHFHSFGALNGVFNAWPYWRELLHSLTSRMGLPAFLLPVLRIGAERSTKSPAEHSAQKRAKDNHVEDTST